MPETATRSLAERAQREWSPIAKEPITVEQIGGTLYAFGSELAVLRLFHKMPHGRADYSRNRKTWYFVIETHL